MSNVKRVKCQMVMLPTKKANSLSKDNYGRLYLGNYPEDKNNLNQHIYILSDNIKSFNIPKGSWFYDTRDKTISNNSLAISQFSVLIIATTDTSLMILSHNGRIGYTLPQPSPQFIQKYVELYNRGEVIDRVMVDYEESKCKCLSCGRSIASTCEYTYKCNIQIISSEPKVDKNNYITITKVKDSWSREEVRNLILDYNIYYNDIIIEKLGRGYPIRVDKWIEENL
jgi:hypothetical protein